MRVFGGRVAVRQGRMVALAGSALMALAFGAGLAQGQDAAKDPAKIVHSYGYSTFGDLKYPKDFKHFDYVNPDAPKGGEISIWSQGTFDNFNPYTRKGRAGALSTIGYELLLTSSADEVSGQYCLLCESLEYPETEDWVIFHLRHDVKFSDGNPLTAQDVVYSHQKLLDEGLPSYAQAVSKLIVKAEALDDYTVKFTFNPDVPKKDLISQAGGVPVFEKAWFEKSGAKLNETMMKISPGSGPYMLDSYQINQRIIYKRNPDYWGKDLPVNVGRNNFDSIRVEYFADTDAALEAFKAGVYTFRAENSSLAWATAYDFPGVKNGWVKLDTPKNGNLPAACGFVYNLRRPLFEDLRVRQALGLMFNFEWTNQVLQYGLFKHRDSFWQGSALQAKDVPEGRELELLQSVKDKIDPSILTQPVAASHDSSPDRQLDRKNLRKASHLLEEAGWIVGNDGLRRKDGKTLDVEFLSDSPSFDRIINPYIQNLIQLGVNARYNRIDPSQYSERVNAGAFDFDMIYDCYSNGLEEGIGLSQRYGSDGLGDLFNPAGYASPAVDALATDVVKAKTREEMAAGVRAVDRIMRAAYFMVPSWYNDKYWLAYYDMYGHPDPLPPYALGSSISGGTTPTRPRR